MIKLYRDLQGSILDIGGGGEGIIGRLYGAQVTAIDRCQEELDEAPDGFTKILMDARSLSYPSEYFDNVTFFYSLMFMDGETQKQALAEAARVLKSGGKLCIWDSNILSPPELFLVELDIQLPSEFIHTTYGVVHAIPNQTAASVTKLCKDTGLKSITQVIENGHFYSVFHKGYVPPSA